MKISFRHFLLNENKYYLGEKIGDILSAVQELQQNSEGMGARQLVANAERLADQIRAILHSNWSKQEEKHLKDLQKIGVALAKGIEEKDNLVDLFPAIGEELEKIANQLGTPMNALGGENVGDKENKEQLADSQGKEQQKTDKPKTEQPGEQQQPMGQPDQQQAPIQQVQPQQQPMPQQPMPQQQPPNF